MLYLYLFSSLEDWIHASHPQHYLQNKFVKGVRNTTFVWKSLCNFVQGCPNLRGMTFCVIGIVREAERCCHGVRFETRRCLQRSTRPSSWIWERGTGKGKWKELGMERKWEGKRNWGKGEKGKGNGI